MRDSYRQEGKIDLRVLYKDFLSDEVISYKGNILKHTAYIIKRDNDDEFASSEEILEDYPDFILSSIPDLTQGVESWSKSNDDSIPKLDMKEVQRAKELFLQDPLAFFDTLLKEIASFSLYKYNHNPKKKQVEIKELEAMEYDLISIVSINYRNSPYEVLKNSIFKKLVLLPDNCWAEHFITNYKTMYKYGDYKDYKIFWREIDSCEKKFKKYWLNIIYQNIDSLYKEDDVYIKSSKLPICISKVGDDIYFSINRSLWNYQEKIIKDEPVSLGMVKINEIKESHLLELVNGIYDEYDEIIRERHKL